MPVWVRNRGHGLKAVQGVPDAADTYQNDLIITPDICLQLICSLPV
jgi:hypothetical protein